jgi:hypothetical protein
MGRKPSEKLNTVINGIVRNFKPKQIILKGKTLAMFNYDRNRLELGDSRLGERIISEYYRKNPPPGFESKD